jgi:hypothetical protein
MAWLATLLVCTGARAGAITFFNVQYDAAAVAVSADGPPGASADAGLLGPDLVSVSADSIGSTDVATAGALVGMGFLSTSADVSASGFGSAVASARFTGSFLNAGAVNLSIDFTALDLASGSGDAATTLFVSLVSDGVTLFADYVSDSWSFAYSPLLGGTSVLDLTLSSEASAAFLSSDAGNGSAFGMVTFGGTVPEAPSLLLSALGLVLLAATQRRGRRG